jgi:sugar lactone lactonase YvrE
MKFPGSLWRRTVASAIAATLVVACGGGGGGGGTGSENGGTVPPSPPPLETAAKVTLLAGSLQRIGSMDGTGIEAQFAQPSGLALDPAGNLYIADTLNYTIRKMDPRRVVTTYAGTAGQPPGIVDGVGSAARFSGVLAVAADGQGNVYVGEGSGVIRKILPGGIVSTFAGVPNQFGAVDGPGPTARFFQPNSLAADSAGNVYVADTGSAVREISPDGNVTTFAGKSNEAGFVVADSGQARFQSVSAVAVDAQDRVYVSEGNRLRRFDSAGHALPWGNAPQGVVTVDPSLCPFGKQVAAAPNGDLIMVCADRAFRIPVPLDQLEMRILRVTPDGSASVIAGKGLGNVDGPASVALFNNPWGVAVRADGSILVSELGNHAIRKIDTQGNVSTIAGGTGEGLANGQGGAARFNNPGAVAAGPNGNLYVADQRNGLVRRVDPAGNVSTLAITRDDGSTVGAVPGPFGPVGTLDGVAVGRDGTPWISDETSPTARGIGTVDTSGRLHLLAPSDFARNMAAVPGAVYYAVSENGGTSMGIQKLLADGTKKIVASGFKFPQGMAADAAGTVYVADTFDHVVRAIDPQGNVRLVAGKPGEAGDVDGSAEQSRLDNPAALTIDDAGNLYVSDASATIRKITPAGQVSTVAGRPDSIGGIVSMVWRSGVIYATIVNAVVAIGPLP